MRKITVMLLGAAMLVVAAAAGAYADQIKIGVGVIGPISPQTEADIDQLVGKLPNVKAVPIQPPGGVDACVKRFVAGDPEERVAVLGFGERHAGLHPRRQPEIEHPRLHRVNEEETELPRERTERGLGRCSAREP